jgi:hypothetical protein
MTTFRVRFIDGTAIHVDAETSSAARDIARTAKGGGIVAKVKVLREPKS